MDAATWTALITIGIPAFLAAVATPIIVAWVQSRSKRQDADIAAEARKAEKQAEWNRADALEARAALRAAAVAKRAEETATLLIRTTIDVREAVAKIDEKVDEVHVLTNSSYTAALQAALEAVQAKLVVLLRDVAFRHNNSLEVDAEALADIAATRKKMEELTAAINERLRQDALAKEEKAKAILVGKQQQPPLARQPLPVADDRTATATERAATASERVADAAERTADQSAITPPPRK